MEHLIQRLQCELQQMEAVDIEGMIDPERLASIQSRDDHPQFRAYSIAHEGVSKNSNLVGKGAVALKWVRDKVIATFGMLKAGTPVFDGHGSTNSTANRESIGEIVGKTMSNIGGVLHTIAAVWLKPEHRDKKLDGASIEAGISVNNTATSDRSPITDWAITALTGLGLADKDQTPPALAGTTMLGQIQQFETGNNDSGGNNVEPTATPINLQTIRAFISEQGTAPSALFGADVLAKDETVVGLVNATKEESGKLVTAEKEKNTAAVGTMKADRDKWRVDASMNTAKTALDTLSKERKVTDMQKAFVEKRFASFKPDIPEDKNGNIPEGTDMSAVISTQVGKHLDGEIAEFTEFGKIYGVEDPGTVTGEDDPKPEMGGGDKSAKGSDKNYTDKKDNDFIA